MRIELCGGKYVLKSDAMQMWLVEIKTSKEKGTEYEESVCGYHPTLESLLAAVFRRRILLSEAETLKELARDIADATRELEGLVAELDGVFARKDIAQDEAAKTPTKAHKGLG
jgi:hypothetical protein